MEAMALIEIDGLPSYNMVIFRQAAATSALGAQALLGMNNRPNKVHPNR